MEDQHEKEILQQYLFVVFHRHFAFCMWKIGNTGIGIYDDRGQ